MAIMQATIILLLFTLVTSTSSMMVDTEACPKECLCHPKLFSVSCTDGTVPDVHKIPPDTQSLSIRETDALVLANNSFEHLLYLRYLDMSENRQILIGENFLVYIPRVKVLILSNNNMQDGDLTMLGPLSVINTSDHQLSNLTSRPIDLLMPGHDLVNLNLASNDITSVPIYMLHKLSNLLHLNMSRNNLTIFEQQWPDNSTEYSFSLQVLDLSHNSLITFAQNSTAGFDQLRELYLDNNNLAYLEPEWFEDMENLRVLTLSFNPIISIPGGIWSHCSNLQWLNISYMDSLLHVDSEAFDGVDKLISLDLSHNRRLAYIHAMTFRNQTSLTSLNLSNNALQMVDVAMLENFTNITFIDLSYNPWHCNCDSHWLGLENFNTSDNNDGQIKRKLQREHFICESPPELKGKNLYDILPTHNFSCQGANIVNYTEIPFHTIGSAAVINCVATGDPMPSILWTTPRKEVLHYQPAYVHPGRPGPQYAEFHQNHFWHTSLEYFETLPSDNRIHVLLNGSLYIDYVLRKDAGLYTCLAYNQYGNHSVSIHFRLNYLVIRKTMIKSVIIGFIAAAGFFVLGLVSGIIRYLAFKCSHEQRQKRKSIREILGGLETYRSDKMDKLSAYKTAKIDQLAAFKTAKVDQLRGYKNLTVTPLVQYLHKSREYYANQSKRVRDNCAQQVEKVRESYSLQKLKFKDYRSHQIDKIRDNYNGQLLKIRQYGSNQMDKLREQYKFQQQHIFKLFELLDIGNCMTVIEAECLRTESMIFNPDLTFDLDEAVYLPRDDSQSEYMTAGDTTDNSPIHSQPGTPNLKVKMENEVLALKRVRQNKNRDKKSSRKDSTKDVYSAGGPDNLQTTSGAQESENLDFQRPTTSTRTSSSKDGATKSKTNKKRHRQRPERQDTQDEDDELIERPHRRRFVSKESKEKREQRKQQKYIQDDSPDPLVIKAKRLVTPEELNRTLREIVIDMDRLKRTPLTLSLPELNLDFTCNISTDEEITPMHDPSSHEPVCVHHPATNTVPANEEPGPSTRHNAQDHGKMNKLSSVNTSIDAQSTDYESAHEPESRNTTPVVGFYENTGSPQSFASFPSTPSTPTISAETHQLAVLTPDSSPYHIQTEHSKV